MGYQQTHGAMMLQLNINQSVTGILVCLVSPFLQDKDKVHVNNAAGSNELVPPP